MIVVVLRVDDVCGHSQIVHDIRHRRIEQLAAFQRVDDGASVVAAIRSCRTKHASVSSVKVAAANVTRRCDPGPRGGVRKTGIDLSRDQTIAWVRITQPWSSKNSAGMPVRSMAPPHRHGGERQIWRQRPACSLLEPSAPCDLARCRATTCRSGSNRRLPDDMLRGQIPGNYFP